MELVRISLAFSACCFACSDIPVTKKKKKKKKKRKEVSVSLSLQLDRNIVDFGQGI